MYRGIGSLVALSLLATPAIAISSPELIIETPSPGAVVRGRLDMAPLEGVARGGKGPAFFDVMLVVDVSGSTKYPSGIDVDEDGEIGVLEAAILPGMPDNPNSDPGDSVLAAEVMASRRLLDGLDPDRVRVGLVSFSGRAVPPGGRPPDAPPDALLEQPLTDDFAAVHLALERIVLRGAHGGTNMQAGIKLALRELAGLSGAQSRPRKGARRVILFLTDGKPSLPFGESNREDPEDGEAAVAAARLAKAGGVTINVFGLGPWAMDYPPTATEMTRVTHGLYTPVRRPGDIVTLLTGVSFANVEGVVAVNLTLGEISGPNDIELRPDGSFKGFVPVRPGKNRIRISALATDGQRVSREVEITFQRQDLTDAELQAELARIRKRSRDLQLLMEQERQKAFRKAERDRAISIEIENEREKKP